MILWLIIVLVLIIIMLIPIKFKVAVFYDAINNYGKLNLFLTCFKMMQESFAIGVDSITFWRKNKQSKTKFSDIGKSKFFDRFMLNAAKVMRLNTLKTNIEVGVKDNCYLAAMIAGYFLCFQNIMFSILTTKKKIIKANNYARQIVNETALRVCLLSSVSLNLFQIIYCFVKSIIINEGSIKYGKSSERNC